MAIRKTDPRGIHAIPTARSEVQGVFDEMAHALLLRDGDGVAAMYDVPALIISDDGVHAVSSSEEAAKFFGSAKDEYNALGVVDMRPDVIDLERIGAKLYVATVRWPHLDASGREVASESSDYTLRRDDKGRLKIRSVLMRGMAPAPQPKR